MAAVVLTLTPKGFEQLLDSVLVYGTLALDGGDLTATGDVVPIPTTVPGVASKAIFMVFQATDGYVYQYDPANGKVLVFQQTDSDNNVPMGQVAAAAITDAGVTFFAIYRKFNDVAISYA